MSRTCEFVDTLASLPVELQSVRDGQGSVQNFRVNLARSKKKLLDNRREVLFSRIELQVMQALVDAVDLDWATFGANNAGSNAATDHLSAHTLMTIGIIVERFGCNNLDGVSSSSETGETETIDPESSAPLRGVDAKGIDPLIILGALAAVVLTILVVLRLMRYGQRDKRMICRVPAVLRVHGKDYQTQIMNISRGGVMIAMPDTDIDQANVTLRLQHAVIDARVVWTNSNFAGVVFSKRLSMARVEEIARSYSGPNSTGSALQTPGARSKKTRLGPATG